MVGYILSGILLLILAACLICRLGERKRLKTLSGRNYRNITIRAITESGITMRFTQNFRGCIQF